MVYLSAIIFFLCVISIISFIPGFIKESKKSNPVNTVRVESKVYKNEMPRWISIRRIFGSLVIALLTLYILIEGLNY